MSDWKIWLAFCIGGIGSSPHCHTSGRDALRSIRARFDQMGVPEYEWEAIESAALKDETAIGISSRRACIRVVDYLAGGIRPIGPLNRIK